MLRLFGATENYGQQENIFNLTVKISLIFEKRFTVFTFFRFKLLFLARTFVRIRHRRALKFVGSSNLLPYFGLHRWNPAGQ
jgi:hypothetical protein